MFFPYNIDCIWSDKIQDARFTQLLVVICKYAVLHVESAQVLVGHRRKHSDQLFWSPAGVCQQK